MESPKASRPTSLMRIASSEGSIALRHPTPDLQSLQGAYVGNVDRLEMSAERMSVSSHDLGSEIRKMQEEIRSSESRSASRRSSLRSAGYGVSADDAGSASGRPPPANRSRQTSTSSYANSIMDVNTTARWGGYSPNGYVNSPLGSAHSGSLSQLSWGAHLSQQPPAYGGTRPVSRGVSRLGLAAMELPEETNSLTSKNQYQAYVPQLDAPQPPSHSRQPSHSSHFDYDAIVNEVLQELEAPRPQRNSIQSDMMLAERMPAALASPVEVPDRPATAASGDTFQQATTLFKDFDGVHYSPTREPYEHDEEELRMRRRSSMLRMMPQPPPRRGEPPPNDGMVYYPAPVPRMLNLPERLSKRPAPAVQARRRTQMLDELPPEARQSAVWLENRRESAYGALTGAVETEDVPPEPSMPSNSHARRSTANLSRDNIPPQLRAGAFFDQQSVHQEVDIQGESAMATLDSILEASAKAPVGAFTNHPYAGQVSPEVYAKPHSRQSSAQARNSRSTVHLVGKPSISSLGSGPKTHQRAPSKLSMATGLNDDRFDDEDDIGESTPLRQSMDEQQQGQQELEEDQEEVEEEEEQQRDEFELDPGYRGPPTTLLAELQMRKAQLRNRNRTAADAFPNGMHSTLLQLDAVAAVESKRRKQQRVALAWEDPVDGTNDEDEEVPLGMLFPHQQGLIKKIGKNAQDDWDRPLGLMERRELEDNEPLSARRNRLRGGAPSPQVDQQPSANGTPPLKQEDSDHEGETLAQRKRRLRDREALDKTIKDISGVRSPSGDFSSELMSQFGGLDKDENAPKEDVPEEEETLGQRRARLHREAAQANNSPSRTRDTHTLDQLLGSDGTPLPRKKTSLANLLSSHPYSGDSAPRKPSGEPAPGTLLHANDRAKVQEKSTFLQRNEHSMGPGTTKKPLVDVTTAKDPFKDAGKIAAFKGGVFNNGSAGVYGGGAGPNRNPKPGMGMPQPPPQMGGMGMNMGGMGMNGMAPMGGMNGMPMNMPNMNMSGYFGNQMAFGGGGMMGYQQPQPPMNMGMGTGMGGMGTMGMGGMGMGMGGQGMMGQHQMGGGMMPPEIGMDPKQRDMIDRWRQSIM